MPILDAKVIIHITKHVSVLRIATPLIHLLGLLNSGSGEDVPGNAVLGLERTPNQ